MKYIKFAIKKDIYTIILLFDVNNDRHWWDLIQIKYVFPHLSFPL